MKHQEGSGEWLQGALLNLCSRISTGLCLDEDLISGLVSYCEMAPPEDAIEYLNNIIGQEVGQPVIEEYLQRRGCKDKSSNISTVSSSNFQAYMKPRTEQGLTIGSRKQEKMAKPLSMTTKTATEKKVEVLDSTANQRGKNGLSKKKKSGKVVSLEEAIKGTVVFQKGKPCSCQARQHKLVSNCLSCGKIVCEQEGEGPCGFCGALVLKEGSTYGGLEGTKLPLSDVEAKAEAFAKRLVDYDRNSASRTTVIDDQSDYYHIEGNSWLSPEEKDLLIKKQQAIEEADRARRNKVVITFDLVGRKVLVNEDEAIKSESMSRILRPPDEREMNRIKPNPSLKIQPIFVDPSLKKDPIKGKDGIKPRKVKENMGHNGLCLHISGRVQQDVNEMPHFIVDSMNEAPCSSHSQKTSLESTALSSTDDSYECSLDYD